MVALMVARQSETALEDAADDVEFVDDVGYEEATDSTSAADDDPLTEKSAATKPRNGKDRKKSKRDAAAKDGDADGDDVDIGSADADVTDSDAADEFARHGQAGVKPPPRRDRPVAPDPDTTPDPDVDPAPLVPARITREMARDTLRDAMTSWSNDGSYADFVTASSHIATFELPVWKEGQYELESYSIEAVGDFKSDTEKRFWVVMNFRNQGTAAARELISMTINDNGRWVIRPVAVDGP